MRHIGAVLLAIDVIKVIQLYESLQKCGGENYMNQNEHIEQLIQNSKRRVEIALKIQEIYQKYINNDEAFTEMIEMVDSYCLPWIRKTLWKTGCYNDENEYSILQEAKIAVWKNIENDKKQKITREKFAYFAFNFYKYRTLDLIRSISRKRAKRGTEFSLDETLGDNKNTLGENLSEDIIKKETKNELEEYEKRTVYTKLFHTYCLAFMNSAAFPPRSLALYYARVLPHLLCVNHNEKTIPDSKATSAKWAFERMGEKTIENLKNDSEKTLQIDIADDLCWCEEFVRQLNEKADIENEDIYLKDVVYTAVYNKGKIEDWADYTHKAVTKAARERVINDSELLILVKEYVSQKDVLYNFVKGGERK